MGFFDLLFGKKKQETPAKKAETTVEGKTAEAATVEEKEKAAGQQADAAAQNADATKQAVEKAYKEAVDALEKKDYLIAIAKFEKAAEGGHARAANNLGVMYANGMGVERNMAKAVEYWEQSKNADAYNNLGICYEHGLGIEADVQKAIECFRLAINGGNEDAEKNLEALEKKLKEQEAAAQAEAQQGGQGRQVTLDELIKIAESGNHEAQFFLAGAYYMGRGVEKDLEKAIYWMEKSATNGNAQAQYNLGMLTKNGIGMEADAAKGLEWIRKAAEQKFPHALYDLGVAYHMGDGVELDMDLAVKYLNEAAAQGHEEAKALLAQFEEPES